MNDPQRRIEPDANSMRLHDLATLRSVSRAFRSRSPLATGRNTGPAVMPAALIQALNAVTGHATAPRGMATTAPLLGADRALDCAPRRRRGTAPGTSRSPRSPGRASSSKGRLGGTIITDPSGDHVTLGHSQDNDGGKLTVADGFHIAKLALLGNYMAASFVTAADGHGGTLITEGAQMSNQQLLLTQPRA